MVKGLSSTTCLPAFSAREVRSKCVSFGRADDDEVEAGVGKEIFRIGDDVDAGVVAQGEVAAAGGDDGGELKTGNGRDEGAMEDTAGKAVADDSGADGAHRARGYATDITKAAFLGGHGRTGRSFCIPGRGRRI